MMTFSELAKSLDGELHFDDLHRTIYATDASIYKELPIAVAFPKTESDLLKLIDFSKFHNTYLIPRSAGTSLAGQCVGDGIVVDISKYMNQILDLDVEKKQVWVQPGVIRDELNRQLQPHGLFFAPNTSTSNRCMIGGMFGNNSCGTTSIEYGSTRDHVLEAKVILADGSKIHVKPLTEEEFKLKLNLETLEGKIYRKINVLLNDSAIVDEIYREYPDQRVHRRNQGYAIDVLLKSTIFGGDQPFNLCQLLAGSEGTLALTTAVCLQLKPLPAPHAGLVCAQFGSIYESMLATQIAMKHHPSLCELMDKFILDCTTGHPKYGPYGDFVEGDPEAVLMMELRDENPENLEKRLGKLITDLKDHGLGYTYPILKGEKAKQAFDLRTAGLGLMANVPGDAKPVACIEDTAVALEVLPEYIRDFENLMKSFNQKAVFYAHAGAGELHLRPILDLKTKSGVKDLYNITKSTAELVKLYNGSFSGEHGDGRVRASFLPLMIGQKLYDVCRDLKFTFDPENLFNRGKIVDAKPMTEDLRYETGEEKLNIDSVLDFGGNGMMEMIERCNGSGDCRQIHTNGATMCPSYMATLDEIDTTRARANALREFMKTSAPEPNFSSEEVMDILDLCVSCKACKSECPSNVDMALLKSEYTYQYYKNRKPDNRSYLFAHYYDIFRKGKKMPGLVNFGNKFLGSVIKKALNIAPQRSLPQVAKKPLDITKINKLAQPSDKKVMIFVDEFLELQEPDLYWQAFLLLTELGYQVKLIQHEESGRAAISKGFLEKARNHASANVDFFSRFVSPQIPLIGLEPSAILTFRDEYPKLLRGEQQKVALKMAKSIWTIEEFMTREIDQGHIHSNQFGAGNKEIIVHTHCHQKAQSSPLHTVRILELPHGNKVTHIPSACCGMAGSFGYEAEHYDISKKMAELVLIPTIEKSKENTLIVATGTSCRHQIADFSSRKAKHPVEVLYEMVKK